MAYNVVITSFAEHQLKEYIEYTCFKLKNKQAASAILADARKIKNKLSSIANNLALCQNKILAQNGYRRIMFEKHKFFMIYRIIDKVVIVEAMYHESQDYEAVFIQKMHL